MKNTESKEPLSRGNWLRIITLFALAWFGSTATTQALTNTWSGGGGNNKWSTVGNWDQGALATTDTNYFNGAGSYTTINLDTTPRTIGGLLIGGSQLSALTLTNTASTLTNGAFGIDMSAAGADLTTTIGGIALGANQTWTVGNGRTLYVGSVVSGAKALTKDGAGTLTLTGANTYSGGTTNTLGTLAVSNNAALGTGPVTMNGGSLTNAGGTRSLANVFNLASAATVGVGGTDTLTLSGVITNSGSLTKVGSGTLVLSVKNSYSGATTVNGGTLVGMVTSGSCSNSAFTVAAGATNGVQIATANGKWFCNGLTNAAGGTLDFNFVVAASTNTANAPLQVLGSGQLNLADVNIIVRGYLSSGTNFPLVGYNGTIPAPTVGTLTLPVGVSGLVSNDTVNHLISLVVTNGGFFGTVYWAGGGGNWDIASTMSWKDNPALGGATALYNDGEPVVFDDSASGSSPILVTNAVAVSPASVTVNSAMNYTISGSPIAGSTALTKSGAGTLTLTGTNTYTGGTTISAGTLTVNGGMITNSVILVGNTAGTTAFLVVTNGGKVYGSGGIDIGQTSGSATGIVIITGNNSLLDNGGGSGGTAIQVGIASSGNQILVSDGGVLTNGPLWLCYSAGVHNNSVIITNGGRVYSTSSGVNIGGTTLQAGGNYSNWIYVGSATATPSLLNGVAGNIKIGSWYNCSNNWMTVDQGGLVTNVTDVNVGTASNCLGNAVNVVNGGQLYSKLASSIGTYTGAGIGPASNSVTIAGAYGTTNSLWNMGGKALTIGGNSTATGNWMTVSTGGVLTNGSVTLGGVGSVFNLSGQAYLSSVTNGASGTFTINGAGMLGNGVFTGNITNDGAFVFASSADQTLSGPVSGFGSLTNLGSGVLTLTGTNTYTGVTIVSAGELVGVTGGSCSNSEMTVASGATSGVQIATAGGTWACKALTNNLGGAMDFNFVTPAVASSAPIQVLGDLDVSGVNVIVRGMVSGGVGSQYELIKYQGVLSGTVPATAVSLPAGVTGTLSNNTANHSIDLVLTSTSTNYWAVGSGNWNVSAMNWKDTAASGVTNAFYIEGEAVVLDDTASGAGPILVTNTATVSPASVTVSNVAKAYTISGAAISGGAALTKLGANTLTLSSNNTYSGGTTVNAGTLVVGNTNALGTGLLTMGGGVLTNAAGTWTFTNAINLAGTATVGIKGTDLLTLGGIVTNSGSLTKTGAGTLTLANANTYSGGTTNTLGALAISNNTALGSGTVTMNGGSLTNAGGNWTVANVFDLASAATVGVGGTDSLTLGGIITNSGALTKAGTGTLTLTGTNSYSGATTNSAGTLLVNGGGITNTASMTLNGTGASLILTNGASLFSTNTSYIGNGANGNTVFIYSNSLWNAGAKYVYIGYNTSAATSNSLTVADGGILTNVVVDFVGAYGNLVITNGGKVFGAPSVANWAGFLGDASNSNSNRVYVGSSTGSKSVWDLVGKTISLGRSTSVQGNGVVVDAGGLVTNGSIRVGDGSYNNGNYLIITNGGYVQASIYVGAAVGSYGTSNYVVIAGTDASGQRATLKGALNVGNNFYATGNWARVEAGGMVTNTTIVVGTHTPNINNCLIITNGGQVFSSAAGTVGLVDGANSNSVIIAGAYGTTNALWDLGGYALTVGGVASATGNWMTVSTGGVLTNGRVTLGGVGPVFTIGGDAYLSNVNVSVADAQLNFNGGTLHATANGNLISGTVWTNNTAASLDAGGYTVTNAVLIAGVGSLTNLGSGTLMMISNNTYSGATVVNAGKLIGITGGSCSNSAFAVAAGGTNGVVVATSGGTWTCKALTSSAGGVMDFTFTAQASTTASDAPIQVLNTLDASNVRFAIRGAIAGLINTRYPLVKYASLVGAGPWTVSLPEGVSGSIEKNDGTHTLDLVLTANSAVYRAVGSGNWDVNSTMNWKVGAAGSTANAYYQDTLPVIFDDSASGTGILLVTNVANVSPTSVLVSNTTAKSYLIRGAMITGSAALTKEGVGTLILGTNNAYTGGTTINAGTLVVSNANALGTGSVTLNSGTLRLGSSLAITNLISATSAATIDLGGAGRELTVNEGDNTTFAGAMTNAGSLVKAAAGTLTLTGTNSYSGATTVSNGTLAISGTGVLGNGVFTGSITNHGAFVFASSAVQTLSGPISGSGSLTNLGPGTLTLGGNNTYVGNTTVSNGTLLVDGSIASSACTVNSGATLGGTGTVGAVIMASGATNAPGHNGVGTLHSGNVELQAGSTLAMQIDSGANAADKLASSGAVTIGSGAKLSLSDLGTATLVVETSYVLVSRTSGAGTTFDGYPEGHYFRVGQNDYRITYKGGAGYDVVIIRSCQGSVYKIR